MSTVVLLWGDGLLALAALVGVVRLGLAQRRHARETQVKVATLARLLQSRRVQITFVPGSPVAQSGELSLKEVHALRQLRQRANFDPFERIAPEHEPHRERE